MKVICIDLDGVLNTYDGKFDETLIPPIKEGAREFLEKIYKKYEIKLFTSRNKLLASKWVYDNELDDFIKDITSEKQPAWIYIDDRALKFNGDYDELYENILNFKVWYK